MNPSTDARNDDLPLASKERIDKVCLDFEDAWRVYEADDKVTYKSLSSHEERWVDLAEVEGVVLLLVYTIRSKAVRCISFRRAKRGKERSLYYGQDC